MNLVKKVILLTAILCNFIFASSIETGTAYFNNGKFAKSQKIFAEILKNDPTNHKALFFLAKISLMNKESKKAIDFLEKAIKLEKSNSSYYLWLGKAYFAETSNVGLMSKGSVSAKGREACLEAIKLDPNNLEARFNVAMYYHSAPFFVGGDDDKAWEQQKEILKRNKKMGYRLSALFYQSDKEYEDAIKEYNKMLELDKNDTDIYYQIGILYQTDKEYEKAYTNFEKAVSISEKAYNSLYQLGRNAVFSKKHLDRGIECLKKYLAENPKGLNLPSIDGAHWRLGTLYQIQGKKEMAKTEFKTALKLSPGNSDYQDSLDDLD